MPCRDLGARWQDRERSHPHAVAKYDRAAEEGEGRVRPVVIARAQVTTLADTAIRPDADRTGIVDPDLLAQPDMISNFEKPRVFNADTRLDHHLSSNLCTKCTQYE